MPMGMKTAPAAFQRLVDIAIIQAMPYPTACYIDDVMLASPGEEQHLKHLGLLLQRMRETGLNLKVEKLELFQKEVTFLGHQLTESKESKLAETKWRKSITFLNQTTWMKLSSFLGLASYYRKFIPNYAKIAKSLTNALKGGQNIHLDITK